MPTSYDPAKYTVTFRVAGKLTTGQKLQATVRGTGPDALEDSSGQFLDGNHDGVAGGDAAYLLKVPRPGKKSGKKQ